jgi:hypothetical protein
VQNKGDAAGIAAAEQQVGILNANLAPYIDQTNTNQDYINSCYQYTTQQATILGVDVLDTYALNSELSDLRNNIVNG